MPRRPEVLFFDVNETLLDISPLQSSVAQALGGNEDAAKLWFTTVLQYTLVESAAKQHHAFDQIGVAVLRMIAGNHHITLSEEQAREVLMPIRSLAPYQEVEEALTQLRRAGYQMVALTNSSSSVLKDQIKYAGLNSFFGYTWSVADIGLYKPHREVYQWAAQRYGADPRDCLLVAAHGWDVAGALWAGLRAAFTQRPGHQLYPLAPEPEHTSPDLSGLVEYLVDLD